MSSRSIPASAAEIFCLTLTSKNFAYPEKKSAAPLVAPIEEKTDEERGRDRIPDGPLCGKRISGELKKAGNDVGRGYAAA
jgi:hypothetical protein